MGSLLKIMGPHGACSKQLWMRVFVYNIFPNIHHILLPSCPLRDQSIFCWTYSSSPPFLLVQSSSWTPFHISIPNPLPPPRPFSFLVQNFVEIKKKINWIFYHIFLAFFGENFAKCTFHLWFYIGGTFFVLVFKLFWIDCRKYVAI